jgi:hypothetical protein
MSMDAMNTDQFAEADRLYGANDVEAMFGGSLIRSAPWQRAPRRKSQAPYDKRLVHEELSRPPEAANFADVDPRRLLATQPSVTRGGVAYYMSPQFHQTGRTFADQGNVGNAHPFVYNRDGQDMLLSGHHRAAAALLQGRPLRARRVEGSWGPK